MYKIKAGIVTIDGEKLACIVEQRSGIEDFIHLANGECFNGSEVDDLELLPVWLNVDIEKLCVKIEESFNEIAVDLELGLINRIEKCRCEFIDYDSRPGQWYKLHVKYGKRYYRFFALTFEQLEKESLNKMRSINSEMPYFPNRTTLFIALHHDALNTPNKWCEEE